MFRRVRSRLTYANVASSFALFIALTTGTVYAANEWTGVNIVDGSLTYADLKVDTIGSARIKDESLGAVDLAPDSVGSSEIADESITAADLGTDSVQASEIQDNSIDSGEIVDNSLLAQDLAPGSVGTSEIADGTVTGADVANNTLTGSDFAGATGSGTISIGAGSIANGRCNSYTIGISGAKANDVLILSTRAALQAGVLLYGQRVQADGQGTMIVCNLSGTTLAAISNLPISILSITL